MEAQDTPTSNYVEIVAKDFLASLLSAAPANEVVHDDV
jgi:hypothetical protein